MSCIMPVKLSSGKSTNLNLNSIPDTCPSCKVSIVPNPFEAYAEDSDASGIKFLQSVFICPSVKCRRIFIAYYRTNEFGTLVLTGVSMLRHQELTLFPKNIINISPMFPVIYNQSEIAQNNGLNMISGPGYRKCLEFLIKDFIISYKFGGDQAKTEEIQKAFLGKCISEHIDDPRIKAVSERATWLGNDETHYVRRWQAKDVEDLKSLIRMTVGWIDIAIESEKLLQDMPKIA